MKDKNQSVERVLETQALLHGCDYNPEQWLNHPEILEKDIAYMKEAKVNIVSVGIFSWAMLEPQEGQYNFDWLEDIVDKLYQNGIKVFMATPSGARPKWLSDKYEEVLRVDEKRVRHLFGGRHNHCYTSPIYREKIGIIDHELGKRFGNHPAVLGWHLSNELGGDCHCPLCQNAFRSWLKERYGTIETLNEKWYTTFWSHNYNSFDEVESPSTIGESMLHGLSLDWKRFVTHQTIDFMKHELSILRSYNESIPATTNFMYYFDGLNYFKFKDELDFISWDTYPIWHKGEDHKIALDNGMWHDVMRSIKGLPFILMESTPSFTNWQGVSRPKKPGMHELSSIQAVAHGSDSVMYFQWRQSRGASEKFHGAVVQHDGRNDTRTFREVKALGETLYNHSMIKGTLTKAKVAIVYDWENKWALEGAQGPRNKGMFYKETVQKSYNAMKRLGLDVDFIDMECSLEGYDLVIAPKLYMFRSDIANKTRRFVSEGNTAIMTCWSGVVDENDRCFLGEVPYELTDVFGIRREEFIGMYEDEYNEINSGHRCIDFCEVIHCEGATSLYDYQRDYYSGTAAVTVNNYDEGKAYYIAADFEQSFYDEFYSGIVEACGLKSPIGVVLPPCVHITTREDEAHQFVFLQNYGNDPVELGAINKDLELMLGKSPSKIEAFETSIFKRKK